MAHVITDSCIGSKDRSCVEVCPVDCIYEAEQVMVIHPDECIDCGACLPECPTNAIYQEDDLATGDRAFAELGTLMVSDGIGAVDAAVAKYLRGGSLKVG